MRIIKDNSAQLGAIVSLTAIAVGLLCLAIILTLGPVIGHSVENSITIPNTGAAGYTAAATAWNSNNTAILNGSEVWTQNTPLLGSAAIVVIASVIIAVLLGAFMVRQKS